MKHIEHMTGQLNPYHFSMMINGVRVVLVTPNAPLGLYPRQSELRIELGVAPNGLCPIIYFASDKLTMGDLAKSIGLRSFDCALPHNWVKAEYAKTGEYPRGVWSYDKNRTFGDFVSRDEMIKRLGNTVAGLLGYAILAELDHGWYFDPTPHDPQPGSLVIYRTGGVDTPQGATVVEIIQPGCILAYETGDLSRSQIMLVHLGMGVYTPIDELIRPTRITGYSRPEEYNYTVLATDNELIPEETI